MSRSNSLREGDSYHSFRITRKLPLPELKSTLIEAIHEGTHARVLHIGNEDEENLFCISVQTLPSSSNGVAHILEHIVLCGSKKFPVKDPFFSMTRRSLNTYMNALTGQDFTCYPASSLVEKDFYNLFEVYLDAVFHPELKKMSFLQEGHRIAFREPLNPKTELQFQGVVYNEMKGALSNIESRLWEAVMKHLTPDLPYAVNSGGAPHSIPDLSYEELKAFHQTFYHPSRALFFFYGNLPLTGHLDFLEKQALQNVKRMPPLPSLSLQKRFSSPVKASAFYPISKQESLEKKTWIVFAFLTTPLTDQEEILALSLLESLLMETDTSPLKMALLKSGLCTSADSSLDAEMSEVPFSIVCKGSEKEALAPLKKILFDTLKKVSFSKEEIEASLHQLEFERTEIGTGGEPFGLHLFFRAGLIKQHGSNPENALLIHTLFHQLKQQLANPNFLKQLIHKHFLNNPHYVELTFLPDPHLEEREAQEEEKKLKKQKIDEKAILREAKELAAYQEEIETQSVDCLPKLALSDVPLLPRRFPLNETKVGALEVYHHDCFTNQILYADLTYDLPPIEEKDLSLVSIYSRFLSEMGTTKRNYQDTLRYQQAYTGGVNTSLALHISEQHPTIFHPALSMRGKSLAPYSDKLLSLFADMQGGADWTDTNRVQELLFQMGTHLQQRIVKNSLSYAIQIAFAGSAIPSFVYEKWHGLSFYHEVVRFLQNPKKLGSELARIQELILGRGTPHLVLSCEQEVFDQLQKAQFFALPEKLIARPLVKWESHYQLSQVPSQARCITAPVAFTVKGLRTVTTKDAYAPLLLIAAELFDNCYLHAEIREKGGAYGSGASYAPHTGNFHFYAFRDPHLAKTIDAFTKAVDLIGKGKFTLQDLEEAKFGVLQSLDAPIPPGNRAMVAYSWKRAGKTDEDRKQFRKAILEATKEEVVEAVQKCLVHTPSQIVSFLGKDLYEKEQTHLKEPLSLLPI